MTEELDKQVDNKPKRDKKGQLLPGNTANKEGRPKGQTLKEWVRTKLAGMTPEEREVFLRNVPKEMQWKMAEGLPRQNMGLDGGEEGKPIPILGNIYIHKDAIHTDDSNNQDIPA